MKILYIECSMGAAGDMLMAALLELLPDRAAFLPKMNSLGLDGVSVSAEKSEKRGISGTKVSVFIDNKEETSEDVDIVDFRHTDHCHDDALRGNGLREIEAVLSALPVSNGVKENTLAVYRMIAEAEAFVHGCPASEIHFHELGSLDAVADIVGVCLLMEELAPERVTVSPVNVGSGFVECAHGILPVPAPATARILMGAPSYGSIGSGGNGIKGELCTPTGAALLKHFADGFGPMPVMTIERIGYGLGKKDFAAPNVVRAFFGEDAGGEVSGGPNGQIAELSCNIDDMTAEALAFACQSLLDAGAKDVFTTAIGMKKNRPATLVTCLCDVKRADEFAALMLRHTSTFGVRKNLLDRYELAREITARETTYGAVRVKTGAGYGVTKAKAEYEDVARIAKERDLPINEMEEKIMRTLAK